MWISDWGSGMFDEFRKQNMAPRIDVMLIHSAQLLSIGRQERSWFPVFMIFKYELWGPWVSRTQQCIKLPFCGTEVLMWNEASQPALGYKHALLQVDSRNDTVNFKQVKGKQKNQENAPQQISESELEQEWVIQDQHNHRSRTLPPIRYPNNQVLSTAQPYSHVLSQSWWNNGIIVRNRKSRGVTALREAGRTCTVSLHWGHYFPSLSSLSSQRSSWLACRSRRSHTGGPRTPNQQHRTWGCFP